MKHVIEIGQKVQGTVKVDCEYCHREDAIWRVTRVTPDNSFGLKPISCPIHDTPISLMWHRRGAFKKPNYKGVFDGKHLHLLFEGGIK